MIFKIIFVHLLNDFSGSPRVLRKTIRALSSYGQPMKLFIGSAGDGFLSACEIPIVTYWYRRTGYRILTLFTYFFSQVMLFCKLLYDNSIDKNAVIYVNTLLPFGAALYGRFTGRKVIYHVHEISITPNPLKIFLVTVARLTSSLNIYVSDAHIKALPINGVLTRRVYNALDENFIAKAVASDYVHRPNGRFNVLMIASLRDYKGIPELLILARDVEHRQDIHFDLVVNDDQPTVDKYFAGQAVPRNLSIHSRTAHPTKFYTKASAVLNLSRINEWVETFGLTILEAMAFGIPVIAPPVGGPTELVTDGVHGFLVDSHNRQLLREKILQLSINQQLCESMSRACRERSKAFSPEVFSKAIINTIFHSNTTY